MNSPGSAAASTATDIRLAELLGSLSYALDMAEGQPPGHSVRCCWIGMAIGKELGLPDIELRELFYTLLLKDIGSSSNAARLSSVYRTDDLGFKRAAKLVGDSVPEMLRFRLAHTGAQTGIAERFAVLVRQLGQGGRIANELAETRGLHGAEMARRLRFSDAVAAGIQNLDEHWNGSGRPAGKRATEIPVYSRIALLAQVAEVYYFGGDSEAAIDEIVERSRTWFDPDVVAAFQRIATRKVFWSDLASKRLDKMIENLEPAQYVEPVDDQYLDDILAAFAEIIDSKSPYTIGHSTRVALYADLMADNMGFTRDRRRWLKRSALLHDVGKLGVSNSILDRCGKLDREEWAVMKQHAAISETILARISAFQELARMAASHHERLDGKGYPRGLTADQISVETRILTAADIFDALTAKRPYREAMPVAQALETMKESIGTGIDAACFAALQAVLKKMDMGNPLAKVA